MTGPMRDTFLLCLVQKSGGKQPWCPSSPLCITNNRGDLKLGEKKEADEILERATKLRRYGIVISCNICEVDGHNSATCRNNEHVFHFHVINFSYSHIFHLNLI